MRDELGWQDDAACAQVGTDLWFPGVNDQGEARMAKRICETCPVRAQCLELAITEDLRFGIYGGVDARTRRTMRERARKEKNA